MKRAFVVVKAGGEMLTTSKHIWSDIEHLVKKRGYGVLLVIGGSRWLKKAYAEMGREEKMLTLTNGDHVRYCPAEEMSLIHHIYRDQVIPYVKNQLNQYSLKALCSCASDLGLVIGKKYPALKVQNQRHTLVERGSMVGEIIDVKKEQLQQLLSIYDVVALSAPIFTENGQLLNVDADMLAAHSGCAIDAQHVWFYTTTNGILKDPNNPTSNIQDIYLPLSKTEISVKGRMKQKLRAAQFILDYSNASIQVLASATSLCSPQKGSYTRIWRFGDIQHHDHLLTRLVQIPSISCFEQEAALFLCEEMEKRGFQSSIDPVGNVVGHIGRGERRLLLLGHIDTVPGKVPLKLSDNILQGRGSVDAKSALCCFIEAVALAAPVAKQFNMELCVVGAVEEEVATSRGAFYIRDTLAAEAVIIGEPSGAGALTLGYKGLLKVKIIARQRHSHSASLDYRSCTDQIMAFLNLVREYTSTIEKISFSTRNISTTFTDHEEETIGEFHLRIPYLINVKQVTHPIQNLAENEGLLLEILRETPGYQETTDSELVRVFREASLEEGQRIRLLTKSGTADMNTLATKWQVPMVAYGPGDSSLDHTDHEHIDFKEYEKAVKFLRRVIEIWIVHQTKGKQYEYKTDSPSNTIEMR